MFNVNYRNTRVRCQLWTYLTPFSSVSIVNFELVNAEWDKKEAAVKMCFLEAVVCRCSLK